MSLPDLFEGRRQLIVWKAKRGARAMGIHDFAVGAPFEAPGRSCFLRVDGEVFHTYSQYARGLESTGGSNPLVAGDHAEPGRPHRGQVTGLRRRWPGSA